MLENGAGVLMLFGGIAAIIQNYPRWKVYRDKEDLYWVCGGVLAICTALYLLATQPLISAATSNVVFLIWSRRFLIALGLGVWIILGFRAYILKK
jgi:hypothetical protein